MNKKAKIAILFSLSILLLVTLIYNIFYDVALVIFLFLFAYGTGAFFRLKGVNLIDRYFLQTALGLGVIGFFVWLTTLGNFHTKSIFLLPSIVVIALKHRSIVAAGKNIARYISAYSKRDVYLFPLLIFVFTFFLIVSSFPINQLNFDSLAKHIAIPIQIMVKTNWDYNVIESITFGDSALLPHMFSLYLLTLGATKGVVIFVTCISFLSLILMIRIAAKINRSQFVSLSIALLYLTTPLFYLLSTILYVDILPLFFVYAVILVLINFKSEAITKNLFAVAFIMGTSVFCKQTSLIYMVPLAFYIMVVLVQRYFSKEISLPGILKIVSGSIFLGLVVFLPCLLIVWIKTKNPLFPYMNDIFNSLYVPNEIFLDPFTNKLGLTISSIFSMIYHTSKNIELSDGGLGNYLILFIFTPLSLFFKDKRWRLFFLLLFIISGYFLITLFVYNIRYMIIALAIAIVPISIFIENVTGLFKNISLKTTARFLVISLLIFPSLFYIFLSNEPKMFQPGMFIPDGSFVENPNESVLKYIDEKDTLVLSLNDVFRGTFTGSFYSVSRYSMLLSSKLRDGVIGPVDFVKNFDYVLLDKRKPFINYTRDVMINPYANEVAGALELYKESDSHILYRVRRDSELISSEEFETPLIVSGKAPRKIDFSSGFLEYLAEIDAAPMGGEDEIRAIFWVEWYDENGRLIDTKKIPFRIYGGRKIYKSPLISDIPKNAERGVIYLVDQDEKDIELYSFRLTAFKRDDFLENLLSEYDKTWPHLSR